MNFPQNRGISILISIISVALVFVLAIGTYFYLNYEKSEIDLPDKNSAEQAVSNYIFKEKQIETESVKITHINSLYARAELITEFGLENAFLIYKDGSWQIAMLQSEIPFCEKLEALGFPSSMISDCLLEFPDAKSVSDIKDEIENAEQGEMFQSEIIGKLQIPNDPGANFFEISDGENKIEIKYDITEIDPSDFGNISVGDTVIVNTEITIDENGETEFVANNIEEVNTDGDENENEDQDENQFDDPDLSEEIYYDITDLPPDVAPPGEDFFKLLFDRDFSNQDVQIISDF